jgi:hypothetical protein
MLASRFWDVISSSLWVGIWFGLVQTGGRHVPDSLGYDGVVSTAAGRRRRGSATTGGTGSIARAAWCNTPASQACTRTRLPDVELACRAVAIGASGDAPRPSCFIELMTTKAIISELSIVFFLSTVVH